MGFQYEPGQVQMNRQVVRRKISMFIMEHKILKRKRLFKDFGVGVFIGMRAP